MIKIAPKFLVRFLMILFWLLVIIVYIYSPVIYDLIPRSSKSINLYCWVDMIDKDVVKEFERTTGIDVNISYYEHNYELISKLEVTQGRDYDLIMATDFTIGYLIKLNLLQPLQRQKLDFWLDLEPNILNREFDRNNEYSIPYFWDLDVIGYNNKIYKDDLPTKSWALIFDKKYMPKHLGMVEEANEAFMIAAQYLFNSIQDLSDAKLEEIKNLLKEQKDSVESYVDLRSGDLLISGAASAAVSQSAYICRAMEFSKNISLFVPSEGSFAFIDSLVIPKPSNNLEYTYKFLNFINKKESIEKVVDKFCYLPARKDLLISREYLLGTYKQIQQYLKSAKLFSSDVPIKKINELWMEVKAN